MRTALATALVFLVLAPPASAAAPANDNFSAAKILAGSLPLSVNGTNVEATKEAGEPEHSVVLDASRSVWYSWTAPTTDEFVADSCTADYNSVTAVYTGNALNALSKKGLQRDRCRTEFSATSGTTYWIAVDGTNVTPIPPSNPEGIFTLQIRELNRPVNDEFSGEVLSGSLPIAKAGTNVDATEEPEEPSHGGPFAAASVWYSWTSTVNGPVAIDTCSAGFDTRLAVYTGSSVAGLAEAAPPNDDGCFFQSKVTFNATSGVTYRIAVDGATAVGAPAEGPFTLRIHVPSAPANDNFAGPRELSPTVPVSISATNEDATEEEDEPEHSSTTSEGASVWFKWAPAESGPVAIDTCNSDFQAIVAVYTGTAIGSLTQVAANIYGCGVAGRVNINAEAGTTYRIAVAGVKADQGTIALRIRKRPANDDFADAQALSETLPIGVSGSNVNAGSQPSEPQHVSGGGSGSVWYSWKASATGLFFVESCGSAIDSTVAVYTGTQVNSLTAKGAFRSNCKKYFQATKDTIYQIAVDGKTGEYGATDLVLRAANGPPNDDFANAETLSGSVPQSVEGNTVDSSREATEPETHAGSNLNTTIWYQWTPAANGTVRISDCGGSGGDNILAVYTGSALNALSEVGTRVSRCHVRLAAATGTTYRIVVASPAETTSLALRIRTPDPPPNDALSAAKSLTPSLLVTESGTNVDATKESGEPNHNSNSGSASVWYSWVAPSSASVTIEVCVVPAGFFGMNDVYTAPTANPAPDELVKVGTRKSRCRISLEASAGAKYWIAVDGFVSAGNGSGAEGTFELGIHANSPPSNDDFSAAEPIGAGPLPLIANGTSIDATAQSSENEPSHAGFSPSATVWYSWTPSETKTVVIEGCASAADAGPGPPTAVYIGGTVGSLGEVGTRQGRCRVKLAAGLGTPYKIAIGSVGLLEGGLTLKIRALGIPSNDNFESPQALSGSLPINESGSNLDATRQTGEPDHAGVTGSSVGVASVWYSWTPGSSEEVEINACPTGEGTTLLGVYAGTVLTELERVGTRSLVGSPTASDRLCKVRLDAKSGTTYRIALDRSSGIEGPTQLIVGPPGESEPEPGPGPGPGPGGGSGGPGGSGSSSGSPSGGAVSTPPPAKKLKCKKGFRKVKVKGKPKCKKIKRKGGRR